MSEGTFRDWLRAEIHSILGRKGGSPPFILWCDPDREWCELLVAAAEGDAFQLWAEEKHELLVREELLAAPAEPRVVWVPRRQSDLGFLKMFALQAEMVWMEPLLSALRRFGVRIPSEREAELRPLLGSYAKEFLDRPLSDWPDFLSPSLVAAYLLSEELILEVLAHPDASVASRVPSNLNGVFARRLKEDFGLPAPSDARNERDWRIEALARLLVTDAASKALSNLPADRDRIIAQGAARDNSMKLLERWMRDVELAPLFEKLSREADSRLSLGSWARSLPDGPAPLASRAAEEALFVKVTEELAKLDDLAGLSKRLAEVSPMASRHAGDFWGKRAQGRIAWATLAELCEAASALADQSGAYNEWKTARDAVGWFTARGWKLDEFGEKLIRDDRDAVGALRQIRERLERAYLRHLDQTNSAFSELLSHETIEGLGLEFAGAVFKQVGVGGTAIAVLVLDACRYDLAQRIAERLNRGEPIIRAQVTPARAPLPSITAIGMPFALTAETSRLKCDVTQGDPRRWRVVDGDEKWDLTQAGQRREWLRKRYGLKPTSFTDIKQVLEDEPPTPAASGRMLFVFGDEFDTAGHEGELKFTGAEQHIERYTRTILKLRDAGYSTVVAVTDHGFIHWHPDKDEVLPRPEGEVVWKSRRAIVGHQLQHPVAIKLAVSQSDLECMIPRSVNAFQTYGGIGFFHGGATLQELIIPVLKAEWPRKAAKVPVVLGPIAEILSLSPRVAVRAGSTSALPGLGGNPNITGRNVTVRIIEPGTGRRLFFSREPIPVRPDGAFAEASLTRTPDEVCARGTRLRIEVRDADNDELLDRREVELKVDLTEWD